MIPRREGTATISWLRGGEGIGRRVSPRRRVKNHVPLSFLCLFPFPYFKLIEVLFLLFFNMEEGKIKKRGQEVKGKEIGCADARAGPGWEGRRIPAQFGGLAS
jgi:hypothetical protein